MENTGEVQRGFSPRDECGWIKMGMVKHEMDDNHPDVDEVARFTAPRWEGPGGLTLGGWDIRVHG